MTILFTGGQCGVLEYSHGGSNHTTGAGTFTVMSVGGIMTTGGTGGAVGPVLCPMIPFLAAYVGGRVQSYIDATACPK